MLLLLRLLFLPLIIVINFCYYYCDDYDYSDHYDRYDYVL